MVAGGSGRCVERSMELMSGHVAQSRYLAGAPDFVRITIGTSGAGV